MAERSTLERSEPSPASTPIAFRRACLLLGIGRRRLRGLVRAGRLESINTDRGRFITAESLREETARRGKKRQCIPEKAAIRGNLWEPLPEFGTAGLDAKNNRPDTESTMLFSFPKIGDIEGRATLLPLSRAASEVGLSEGLLKRLVAAGVIPSVVVGSRRRINREVLQRWARGESVGGVK